MHSSPFLRPIARTSCWSVACEQCSHLASKLGFRNAIVYIPRVAPHAVVLLATRTSNVTLSFVGGCFTLLQSAASELATMANVKVDAPSADDTGKKSKKHKKKDKKAVKASAGTGLPSKKRHL